MSSVRGNAIPTLPDLSTRLNTPSSDCRRHWEIGRCNACLPGILNSPSSLPAHPIMLAKETLTQLRKR